MIDEHLGRPAPLHILFKATVDEVLEVGRPFRLNFRWLILNDVEKHSGMVIRNVGGLAHGKLNREDAKRPDIDLVIVLTATFN